MKYTIPMVPGSLNQYVRQNRWKYSKEKSEWTGYVAIFCRPRPPAPFKRAKVTITYFFKTNRRRDEDNYAGKFLMDGLVRAGIIEDDNKKVIEKEIIFSHDKENPRTEIEIMEVIE